MSKCEHNKILYYCRDCKGPGICEHDKRKCYCLECNGASVLDVADMGIMQVVVMQHLINMVIILIHKMKKNQMIMMKTIVTKLFMLFSSFFL